MIVQECVISTHQTLIHPLLAVRSGHICLDLLAVTCQLTHDVAASLLAVTGSYSKPQTITVIVTACHRVQFEGLDSEDEGRKLDLPDGIRPSIAYTIL